MLPLPPEWDPQPRDESGKEEVVHLVSLAQGTQEYETVRKMFHLSMGMREKASITNIERIQNPSMFHSYMVRKSIMDEKNGTLENERQLFHGTKPDSVKFINAQGFNRSLCGIHGKYSTSLMSSENKYYASLITSISTRTSILLLTILKLSVKLA